MEGWLQVPPERNFISRTGWKVRFVRFGSDSPPSAASSKSSVPSSPVRPTTASGAKPSNHFERAPLHTSSLSNGHEVQAPYSLSVYKQKHDAVPIARYMLHTIASCYIGDVAARHKKKSAIMPTLVIHLRADSQPSSPRAFRRRSQETAPAKDASKKEWSSGKETLLFRPVQDDPNSLQRWAREIQSRIIPSSFHSNNNTNVTLESAFQEEFETSDSLVTPPTSFFLINGEPSTALLSPSLRSRASNISSMDSDDKGSIMSSVASELPSPRLDDEFRRSTGSGSRPNLQIKIHPRDARYDELAEKTPALSPAPTNFCTVPMRRETILDRYFSTAPSSPNPASIPAPMNSIARFEAMIREMESQDGKPPEHHLQPTPLNLILEHPRRIPSPTQRALEYVSSGRILQDSSNASSRRCSFSDLKGKDRDDATLCQSGEASRRNSEASMGTTESHTGSICGNNHVDSLTVANIKRHSLADFSMMRMSNSPSVFHQLPGSRRGSYSDVGVGSRDEDELSPLPASGNFSGHPRATRPLFKEFSF
ncbi:hypothetical protein RUND412_005297 [Rhizina undulata]